MQRRSKIATLVTILGLMPAVASSSFAQNSLATEATTSPLGVRQQRVERMIQQLEQKFKSLKLAIQEKEPDRAERLAEQPDAEQELDRRAQVLEQAERRQRELPGCECDT